MVRCRQTKLFLISPTAFPSQTRSSMESCKSGREHISEGSIIIIIIIIIIIVIFTIRNQHWWSSASSQSWRRVSCQSWTWRLGSLTGWILKWWWRITPRQDMSPHLFGAILFNQYIFHWMQFFCCVAMTRSTGAMVLRSTNTPHKFSYLDVHYKQDGKLPPR